MPKHLDIELYPEDGWTDAKIEEVAQSKKSVKQYAYILHDRDMDEDGNLKKPHYHVYLNFGDANVQYEHAAKWFDTRPSMVQKIKSNKLLTLQYYLHMNQPDKHHYPTEALRANFDVAAFLAAESQKASVNKLLAQCADGTITPYNYEAYIDPVIYAKHGQKIARAWDFAEHTQAKAANGQRECTVIWAYGRSGVGKTTACRLYAEKIELPVYMSATGTDPLSHYCGQPALILDDLRSTTFPYDALLKMLDPHYSAPAHSRYRNKTLLCSHIFITTVEHPCDFVMKYRLSANDSAEQLYRRISEVWKVSKDTIEAEKYDLEKKGFFPLYSTENPVRFLEEDSCVDPRTRVNSVNIFHQIAADYKRQMELELPDHSQQTAAVEEDDSDGELPF